MNKRSIIYFLGLSGFLGVAGSPESQTKLRIWLLEMHAHQIELLKIDWGQSGLCTERIQRV